ncbi:acriflavin resistance protein [Opitutaceae bacterium EW11]|nr:acriflavin resistance protein [Opitutaceae bacterium EW11]
MSPTELAVHRPSLVIVLFTALSLLGLYGYSWLKYELMPKISPPTVTVSVAYPAASPSEVETTVTRKIEDAVSGIENVTAVHSASHEGLSLVTIEFAQRTDLDVALQESSRRINQVLPELPDDVEPPEISKLALDELPVLRLGATANLPSRDLREFLEDHVQPRLSRLPGVGRVTLVGGDQRAIRVHLDKARLQSFRLSPADVVETIRAANLSLPTGSLSDTHRDEGVRLDGKLSGVNDLKSLALRLSEGGGIVRLQDVALVADEVQERKTISRINKAGAIGLLVQKQADANTIEVSHVVRTELARLAGENSQIALRFSIAQDSAVFTEAAATAVKHDLGLAILLVGAVMLLFLHSWRSSLIVMVAIPVSLVFTFLVMWMFGYSLNLMTLLALSLVIGILVDDSIVVLENIHRHLEQGEEARRAAIAGRHEIGFAALAITLVDVAVFIPLAVIPGIIGNMVREFSVVVVAATTMSLLVSFTLTPWLASRFSSRTNPSAATASYIMRVLDAAMSGLSVRYTRCLRWALSHAYAVVGCSFVLFLLAVSLLPLGFIGSEFIAQADRGEFVVTIELPTSAAIEETDRVTRDIEDFLFKVPEVASVFASVGTAQEGFLGQMSKNSSELSVALVPLQARTRTTNAVIADIKRFIGRIPGVRAYVNPVTIFGIADATPIQIAISGTDREVVERVAARAAETMRRIPGATDVRLSTRIGKPELAIELDRERLARIGLTVGAVSDVLRVAFGGDDTNTFREKGKEYPITVMFRSEDRAQPSTIETLFLTNKSGTLVPLRRFVQLKRATGPSRLERENRIPAVTLMAQANGRPVGSVVEEFRKEMGKTALPSGVEIVYLGDEKYMQESFSSLGAAFVGALVFVYLIMVALYDSYVDPLIVLFTIPVAIVGALGALALTHSSLSIFSLLGMIMMMGLVAKNGILLVDRAKQRLAEGELDPVSAVIDAGRSRLRPILMTSLAMVIGMLPIALAGGAGSEWKSALAWTLVGGLSSSLFLTLFLVPVAHLKVLQLRLRRSRVGIPAAKHPRSLPEPLEQSL